MRFRAQLFTILALISVLWLCGGSTLAIHSAQITASNPTADIQYKGAYAAGAGVGGAIVVTFFTCSGVPLLLLFLFLAWRNRVGIGIEKRHKEMLQAMEGRE